MSSTTGEARREVEADEVGSTPDEPVVADPQPDDPGPGAPAGAPVLHLSEALVLGGGTAVALLAWASLLLANLGWHSLPAVVALTAASSAVVGLLLVKVPGRPPVRVDRLALGVVLGLGLVAGALSLPGFPIAIADKDPGVYVVHAQAIAREGSIVIEDEVLEQDLPAGESTPGARFHGIWIDPTDDTRINPQFFHLYPALLATADDVAGTTGIFNVNVLLGALAVMAVALAARRAFGLTAGAIAGVLLATNMLQVWQAKFPTTEMLAQLLLALALLAAAVSLETRWRPPAALAGLFVTIGFLARPDGVLLVVGAVAAVAAIAAFTGWDGRLGWFLGGLALPLPHAALQAWDWNKAYTFANDVPTPGVVLALCLLMGAGAVAWRRFLHRPAVAAWQRRGIDGRTVQKVAGVVLAVGVLGFLVFLGEREELLGPDYLDYNGIPIRSYDEINLQRLAWFVTVPGFILLWVGVVILGLRRWRAVQWLVVLPCAALLPVYLWTAKISPRAMWWTRRYVPSALVVILILVAVALAFAFAYRGRWWPVVSLAATVALVGLVATYLGQSLPLREHRELAGSYSVVDELVALSGGAQGVYLWAPTDASTYSMNSVGAAAWFSRDQISVIMPADDALGTVEAFREAYPDQPIFVVTTEGGAPPREVADLLSEPVRIEEEMPFWEELNEERPDAPGIPYSVDLTAWRVAPVGE